jgi:hypothetical protein
METVEAHVGKMEAELKSWGAKLDALVAKADAAGTGAKIDYRRRLDDVTARYEVAQSKLHKLQAAGSGKWDTFKADIESAWSDLETAFKKLTS